MKISIKESKIIVAQNSNQANSDVCMGDVRVEKIRWGQNGEMGTKYDEKDFWWCKNQLVDEDGQMRRREELMTEYKAPTISVFIKPQRIR